MIFIRSLFFQKIKIFLKGCCLFFIISSISFTLTSCAQTQLAVHTAKQMIPGGDIDGGGHYKIGKPYQVNGVWYRPAENPNYNSTGIASWYGKPFHGQFTANGEIYDMDALTAAHKTLPMPSYVRVTNLENGRSLVLKVNDRGPFIHGRIIDVSRRGAQLLGFSEKGTAKVRVQAVLNPNGMERNKQEANNTKGPRESFPVNILSKILPNQVNVLDTIETDLYIQAGAFTNYDSANKLRLELEPIGKVSITSIMINGLQYYRVRIGPVNNISRADATLAMVMSKGYTEARIVVE